MEFKTMPYSRIQKEFRGHHADQAYYECGNRFEKAAVA